MRADGEGVACTRDGHWRPAMRRPTPSHLFLYLVTAQIGTGVPMSAFVYDTLHMWYIIFYLCVRHGQSKFKHVLWQCARGLCPYSPTSRKPPPPKKFQTLPSSRVCLGCSLESRLARLFCSRLPPPHSSRRPFGFRSEHVGHSQCVVLPARRTIVSSGRSASTRAILGNLGQSWASLGNLGQSRAISGNLG